MRVPVGVLVGVAVECHLLAAWRCCAVSVGVAAQNLLRAWFLRAAHVFACSTPCLALWEEAAVDLERSSALSML